MGGVVVSWNPAIGTLKPFREPFALAALAIKPLPLCRMRQHPPTSRYPTERGIRIRGGARVRQRLRGQREHRDCSAGVARIRLLPFFLASSTTTTTTTTLPWLFSFCSAAVFRLHQHFGEYFRLVVLARVLGPYNWTSSFIIFLLLLSTLFDNSSARETSFLKWNYVIATVRDYYNSHYNDTVSGMLLCLLFLVLIRSFNLILALCDETSQRKCVWATVWVGDFFIASCHIAVQQSILIRVHNKAAFLGSMNLSTRAPFMGQSEMSSESVATHRRD